MTNAERNIPILQANRFCTAPTQISSHFFRKILTNDPNMLHRGEMKTFSAKSATIRLTKKRGTPNSALKTTRKRENKESTSVMPVAMRISRSSTKPYLSFFPERCGT